MLKKPVELVVFDLNGTILDDLTPVAVPCMRHIFRTLNLQAPTDHQYRNEISSDFMKFYRKYRVPDWVTKEELNSIRRLWYLQRLHELHFRPGLKEMLKRLKSRGLKLAICSAELTAVMDPLIERDKLREFFGEGLLRSQAWPKSDILPEILWVAGVPASRAVYVDDSADGIEAGHCIGMQTVGFAHPTAYNDASRIYAAKADVTVRSMTELEQVLSKA